jgi:magnesium transporter
VQGLANGTVRFGDIGWRLGEELVAALANGAIAAVVLFGLVILTSQFTAFGDPLRLALTAGVALLTLITLAVAVGAAVPLILDRVGIDPAMAAGVFITTGNDIMAVAVFFLMVTLFYL